MIWSEGNLHHLNPPWDDLFSAEPAPIVQFLVEPVHMLEDSLELRLKASRLASLVAGLRPHNRRQAA